MWPRPLRLFARTASIDRAHQPTCPPTYTRALSIPQDWPNRRPPHPEQPFSPLFGEVVCMLGAVPFRLPARRGNCTTRGCNTPATHRQRASCRAKPPHQPRHRAARLATVRLRHQTNSDQPRPRSPGKRSRFTHRSVGKKSLPFLGDLQETGGFSMKDEAEA